jgi:endonuclease-3
VAGVPTPSERKQRADEVRKRLSRTIPEPRCELDHDNAWQLLVATILSAQSTDKTINRVTPSLFARWPTPAALAAAPQSAVEAVVRPSGFFRNKAKAIRGAASAICEHHGGQVPHSIEQLVELPGVARKTANVVLGTAYGVASGMVVDVHVGRVSRRLGLTMATDPVKVERDLCELIPTRAWVDTGHRLVLHGRYLCTSRAPRCDLCPLNELCPSQMAPPVGRWTDRAACERVTVESRGVVPLAP